MLISVCAVVWLGRGAQSEPPLEEDWVRSNRLSLHVCLLELQPTSNDQLNQRGTPPQ